MLLCVGQANVMWSNGRVHKRMTDVVDLLLSSLPLMLQQQHGAGPSSVSLPLLCGDVILQLCNLGSP